MSESFATKLVEGEASGPPGSRASSNLSSPSAEPRPVAQWNQAMKCGQVGGKTPELWAVAVLCGQALHWGEGSRDLHTFIQDCAEARVAYPTCSSGGQESEWTLGMIVGKYRRLISTAVG